MDDGDLSDSPNEPKKVKSRAPKKTKESVLKQSKLIISPLLSLIFVISFTLI